MADHLVLPVQGAPLLAGEANDCRRSIAQRLEWIIARGLHDGTIRAAVNATDVIIFSALLTQPSPVGPGWRQIAERQVALFTNGLAAAGPVDIVS